MKRIDLRELQQCNHLKNQLKASILKNQKELNKLIIYKVNVTKYKLEVMGEYFTCNDATFDFI